MSSIEEPIVISFTDEEAAAWVDSARRLLHALNLNERVYIRLDGNCILFDGIVNKEENDRYLANNHGNSHALTIFPTYTNGRLNGGYAFGVCFADRENADNTLEQTFKLYSWRLIIAQRAVRAWVRRGRALALAMGMHPRLGSDGLLAMLPVDVLRRVLLHC